MESAIHSVCFRGDFPIKAVVAFVLKLAVTHWSRSVDPGWGNQTPVVPFTNMV